MRAVIAVDWSEEAFSAVQQVAALFRLDEVTLIHAVDLGTLDNPALAPVLSKDVFSDIRQAMVESGERLLDRTAALLAQGTKVTRLCEIGPPSDVILDTARSARADLVALGTRGRGMVAELVLGSVSHRVLMLASSPTLIVKGTARKVHHVTAAIEGPDDARQIQEWFSAHPFTHPTTLSVITVIPEPAAFFGGAAASRFSGRLREQATQHAQHLLDGAISSLKDLCSRGALDTVEGKVLVGNPFDSVVKETERCDLLVVGSHGKHGLNRFLPGSVSHALVHHVARPVLVLR